MFADDLKLVVNANLPSLNQNDLDILSDWQKNWLLSFNTVDNKCKVLHVHRKGRTKFNEYRLNDSVLPVVDTEKDLGINVTNDLKWDYHISQNISKAKQSIGWVSRNVISREPDVMVNIYKLLVRPHLEHCVQLWNPIPKHGNWAVIMELESVQRNFTKTINEIGLLPYKERLEKLKLTTLLERRARGDLIEVFKIFRGLCNYGRNFFNFSRSGMNIVINGHSTGVNNFQIRVAKYWNMIPDSVKMAQNVCEFKIKLESYKQKNFNKPRNYWELSEEIYDHINDSSRQSYVDFMIDNPYIAKRKCVNININ